MDKNMLQLYKFRNKLHSSGIVIYLISDPDRQIKLDKTVEFLLYLIIWGFLGLVLLVRLAYLSWVIRRQAGLLKPVHGLYF